METDLLVALLSGATAMASLVVSLIFLRYWKTTGDALFAAFSLAFLVFAASRTSAALLPKEEYALATYALRAAAFLLIVVAIINKNRTGRAAR